MKTVLTNAQMREADAYTIQTLGVPSLTLMERAGIALADEAEKMLESLSDVVIVAGGGNNGGDGFVCARILKERGYHVTVVCLAKKFTPDAETNRAAYVRAGGEILSIMPRRRYALAVDCLFGTGFKGELTGEDAALADFVVSAGMQVLSADIPSGLSDAGIASPHAVKADKTLCIGEYKAGAFLNDGLDFAGAVVRADIGIALPKPPYAYLLEREDVAAFLPERKRNTHKGSYGKAAIAAGSLRYTGAAYLAGAAALKSGVGYTALFLPKDVLPYFILKLPEALLCPMPERTGTEIFNEYTAVAYGMGSGISEETFAVVKALLKGYTGKLLLDADALNSLAAYGGAELFKDKTCEVVITPHVKEFSRLTKKPAAEILENGLSAAVEFAKEYRVTVLLKGAATVITDGERTALNVLGTPAQAKGGSGDVLSGLIAGLMAQGLPPFDGACVGAYSAGKAACLAAEKKGEYSTLPTDVLENLVL